MTKPRSVAVELRSESPAQAVRTENKTTGFAGVAYSGAPVRRFFGMAAIDLASLEHKKRVPVTLNHDDNQIVGWAEVENDGTKLTLANGHFLSTSPHGQLVSSSFDENMPWELSVGVLGDFRERDRSKPTKVNGTTMNVDAVIENARLNHVSFVPAGADSNAIAAKLSAAYGADQPPERTSMPNDTNPPAAPAAPAAPQVDVAALQAQLAASNAALKALRDGQRKKEIDDVFGEAATLTAEETAAFMSMEDAQWSAVAAAQKRARAAADPGLFRQEATSGSADSGNGGDASPGVALFGPVDGGKYHADPERIALHNKIVKYQADHKCDYLTAAVAVGA